MKKIIKKHPLAIRWFHWINFPVLFIMIWSGLLIYWANDVYRLGWGDTTILKFFPNTVAIMMDEEALSCFESGEGTPASNQNLQWLTQTELRLYKHLRENNIRLEQEKITQAFAEHVINNIFHLKSKKT